MTTLRSLWWFFMVDDDSASCSGQRHRVGTRGHRRRCLRRGNAGLVGVATTRVGRQRRCQVRSEEEERGLASMIAHGRGWIRTASARGGGASVEKRAARSTSVGGAVTQCLARMGNRVCLPWALAIWLVGRGPLKPGGLHCSKGPIQFPQLKILFQLF
jgi:hypothetical protein